MHSCNVDSDDDVDVFEISLDADDNDAEIENDAVLEQNIINNDNENDDLFVTNNVDKSIVDNAHYYDELQNEIANDAIQITNEEDVNDANCVFADVADDADRSRECRLMITLICV